MMAWFRIQPPTYRGTMKKGGLRRLFFCNDLQAGDYSE